MATIESQIKRLDKLQPAPEQQGPDIVFITYLEKKEHEVDHAECNGQTFNRSADESEDDFFQRIKSVVRKPGVIPLVHCTNTLGKEYAK